MKTNVVQSPIHALVQKWIYDGNNEKDSAIDILLENTNSHVRALVKLHIAQTKINAAFAMRKAMVEHDKIERE